MASTMGSKSNIGEPTPTRRRRVKAPHSKNGCITCKIRHVKCDEQKPYCKKCPKAGWTCDGYAPPVTKPKKPSPKSLVPKPIQPLAARTTPTLQLPNNRFHDHKERQYFRCFSDYTTTRLADFFDAKLWRAAVVHACSAEPPIKYAATAIGALVWESTMRENSQAELMRREFAYREYSKAINLIHNSTSEGTQSIRTTLIACLLFASFELFNSYPETAAMQINSGIRLLTEFDPKRKTSQPIEPELFEAFRILEAQAEPYSDSHRGTEGMPVFFSTLQEARTNLESLIRQTMHWVSLLQHPPTANDQQQLLIDPALISSDSQLYSQHSDLVGRFRRWEEAYGNVWSQAHKSDALSLWLGATVLRLRDLASWLNHLTFGDPSGGFYRFTGELLEVVGAAKSILSHTTHNLSASRAASFSLENDTERQQRDQTLGTHNTWSGTYSDLDEREGSIEEVDFGPASLGTSEHQEWIFDADGSQTRCGSIQPFEFEQEQDWTLRHDEEKTEDFGYLTLGN